MKKTSSSKINPEISQIPLKEINTATRNFSEEVGKDGFGTIFIGKLSDRTAAFKRLYRSGQQARQVFRNEINMMSSFNHENIIPFIGYYDDGKEMIIASEYAVNGSLGQRLKNDPEKGRFITWPDRLKICIDAARGLNYLHSGLADRVVIHSDVKSANILLDENLRAKVCGFGFSKSVPRNQRHQVNEPSGGRTKAYMDPNYIRSSILKRESDVYSFGVVLFEMLSGRLAYEKWSIGDDDQPGTLMNLVERYGYDGLEKLIDRRIENQMDRRSFRTFKEVAYKCISLNIKGRPTMDRIIKCIEEALGQNQGSNITKQSPLDRNLLIPVEEIILATGDFSRKNQIGGGGFGVVYKGQLSERWQNRTAAIKRLQLDGHQGEHEFVTELKMLDRLHHQNIIGLIGYCNHGHEMIIVSEYAANGSLDRYLHKNRSSLTWEHRLKICIGAARGLQYLHSGLDEKTRVIHRDMKSANILLDENLEAKICDFGLSKEGPRNQPGTQVYTNPVGTPNYVDPIYEGSGIVRKESDVYSFGVVLFEMLSGMLANEQKRLEVGAFPQPLIYLVRRYHDVGLDKLIDRYIKDQIDDRSLRIFKELAFQCISYNLEERPTMDIVVKRLKEALEFQVPTGSQANGRDDLGRASCKRVKTHANDFNG